MLAVRAAVLVLAMCYSAHALLPFSNWNQQRSEPLTPFPVVIWHGLGDSAYSPWLHAFKQRLEKMYPGIYVYLVAIKPGPFADQRATLFGNVNEQIDQVHCMLRKVPELRHGFDAVGFSQGGQFLRGYIERYNAPHVRNLITFGSQHMGIADLPACSPYDAICHTVHKLLIGRAYSDYSQNNIVTAQYFRDTHTKEQFSLYNERNKFLHDINNEGMVKNGTYKANLQRLNKFVMVKFRKDATVVPANSSWFSAYEPPSSRTDTANTTIPLRQSALYQEDWIGLRALDRKGALAFYECEGGHMQLSSDCITATLGQYVGRPHFEAQRPNSALGYQALFFILLTCVGLIAMGMRRMRKQHLDEYERLPTTAFKEPK